MAEDSPEPAPEEPTITLPLSEFKKIAMGFRYVPPRDAEVLDNLREKCVLPPETLARLLKVPGHTDYFHIQEVKDGLPFVWDIKDWREIGGHLEALKEKCEAFKYTGDQLFAKLRPRLPTIDGNLLKALCNQWAKDKPDLSMYGIDIDNL